MVVDRTDLRAKFGEGPSDADLDVAILAAYEAIDERYGPFSPTVQEYLRPFGQWVKLGHRASAVSSVKEGTATLEETDYALWPGGRYLRRLSADEPTAWTGWVDVTYTRMSMDAERDRVAIALVDLDINRPTTGLTGITVGPWSEQYAQADDSYRANREAILASLRQPSAGVW